MQPGDADLRVNQRVAQLVGQVAHLKQHKNHRHDQQNKVAHRAGELRQHHGGDVHDGVRIELFRQRAGGDGNVQPPGVVLDNGKFLFKDGAYLRVDQREFVDRAGEHRHQHQNHQQHHNHHQRNGPGASQAAAH